MAMYIVSRRLSAGSTTSQLATSLRYATCWRSFSTSFREERDTFGPINVPPINCGERRLRDRYRILI
ncbi:hypothetical protein V6N12_011554 [Hibiscus sabdariffa]|uniref:Uncharacterized protein n=1 Tax=Hibiscus sabdariffa TaxID=183260 RepID=A0ABR2AZD9_9ROSI